MTQSTHFEPDTIRISDVMSAVVDEIVARLQSKRGLSADEARREVHERIVFAGAEDVQRWVEQL